MIYLYFVFLFPNCRPRNSAIATIKQVSTSVVDVPVPVPEREPIALRERVNVREIEFDGVDGVRGVPAKKQRKQQYI
jgi:hypothetical protein